ncbi:MAG: prealbumin-like fold domain-containing protein [Eggerthellaceae bacterium]
MNVRTGLLERIARSFPSRCAQRHCMHPATPPRRTRSHALQGITTPDQLHRCAHPLWTHLAIALGLIAATVAFSSLSAPLASAFAEEPGTITSITIQVEGFDGELPVLYAGSDFTQGQAVRSDPRFMVNEQGDQILASLIEEKEAQGYKLLWRTDTGEEFDWFTTPVNQSLTVIGTFQEADYCVRVSFDDGKSEDLEVMVPKGRSFEEAYGSALDAPSKEGFAFVDWIDASTERPFEFTAAVTASTSVYAHYRIDEPDRVVVVDPDIDVAQTLTGRCYIGATWSVHPAQFSVSSFTGGLEGCSGTGSCSLPSAAAPSYTWADYTATLAYVDIEAGIVAYDVTITPPGAAHPGGPSNSLGLIGYQTVYFRAEVQKNFGGYVEIQKTSTNPTLSENDTYSLTDAVFGIYDQNDQRVGELITDESGKTGRSDLLPKGTYTIKEERAPQGYATAANKSISIESGSLTQTTIADIPQSSLVDILLQKQDKETQLPYPLGVASLEHAQFKVDYYDTFPSVPSLVQAAAHQLGLKDGAKTSIPEAWGEAKRSWIFETDGTGAIAFDEDHLVSGDAFYYDHEGTIALPLGIIVIEEVKAPEGYLLSEEPFIVTILEQGSDVHVDSWQCLSVPEQVKRGDVSFTKTRAGSMEHLASVPFRITSRTTGESHVIVTDDNGMASTHASWVPHSQNTNQGTSWQDGIWFGTDRNGTTAPANDDLGALPYDTYIIEELRCDANAGMALVEFEVTISRDNTTLDLGTIDNEPFTPEITGEVDKRQTLIDDDGAFAYTIDYRSTSSTWVDEFTTIDHIACAAEDQAHLVSLTTPVSFEDHDGLMNIWYRTNIAPGEDDPSNDATFEGESNEVSDSNETTNNDRPSDEDIPTTDDSTTNACATNPYNPDNPHNERQYSFEGWHLWQAEVSTLEARTLSVDDLSLGEGEWVTDIAFEHGRVEEGFGTMPNDAAEWQRRDRYTETDSIDALGDREYSFDTIQASGRTHTAESTQYAYAPAILHMQTTSETLTGGTTTLYNDACVELYRNIDLHDTDKDTVKQTLPRPSSPLEELIGYLPKTQDVLPGALGALIALIALVSATTAIKLRRASSH